ncbi:MAG TPA: ribosome maturation factor RimM [Acetobacteraceae bacterium]|nr:ribosome maturation factor RimM [Acetobacteraceae bacterium]
MAEQRILMGVVGRPHGVRGLVHVHSYTADPAALAAYGRLTDEAGRAFTLRWQGVGIAALTEWQGGQAVKVADRTAAERLTNMKLYALRDALPAPAEDEFYLADLIGLAAHRESGTLLGTVVAVHDYGGGPSLEIAAEPPLLVPFTRASVPVVDIAAGRVVVAPPAEVDARPEAAA